MWLIDTSSLKLKEFHECPSKKYAILSHTWGTPAEEPTFQELQHNKAHVKPGFEKVKFCCEQARKDGLQWAWVDTCCINKESSTELSEAINSMFSWYQQSEICYVHLADVSSADALAPRTPIGQRDVFLRSRWFTRGWTLQELIAPKSLTFFTQEWDELGTKAHLAETLHSVTGIDANVLARRKHYLDCSIAQRMSWASCRQTTRLEDSAYSLIGLFNINLPLLYGEGKKAFLRLQESIIENSDDETIFAWTGVSNNGSGLLAPSVRHFTEARNIEQGSGYRERPQYFKTNKGVSIQCEMLPLDMNTYAVPLQCCVRSIGSRPAQIEIFIGRTNKDDQYRRVLYERKSIGFARKRRMRVADVRNIFIPTDGRDLLLAPNAGLASVNIVSGCEIWRLNDDRKAVCLTPPADPHSSDVRSVEAFGLPRAIVTSAELSPSTGARREVGTIQFTPDGLMHGIRLLIKRKTQRPNSYYSAFLQFGFDSDFQPVCYLRMKRSWLHSVIYREAPWRSWGEIVSSLRDVDSLCARWKRNNGLYAYTWAQWWRNQWDRTFQRDRNIALESHWIHGKIGHRLEGLELTPLSFTWRFCQCVKLAISFRPVSGLVWELRIHETPPQPRRSGSFRRDLCTKCLEKYACFFILNAISLPLVLGFSVVLVFILEILVAILLDTSPDPACPQFYGLTVIVFLSLFGRCLWVALSWVCRTSSWLVFRRGHTIRQMIEKTEI